MTQFPKLKSGIEGATYISAYVDLLGLTSGFKDLEQAALAKTDRAEIVRRAAKSIGAIARFRQSFQQWYERASENAKNTPPPPSLTPERVKLFEAARPADPILQWVGDCVIISVRLEPENMLRTWRGVSSMFAGVASASLMSLAQAQVCRGGIDIGVSAQPFEHPFDNEVLGSSVAKAYELERAAKVPRILIGKDLQDFIAQSKAQSAPDFTTEMERRFATLVETLMVRDVDGACMVHFLSKLHIAAVSSLGPSTLLDGASSFVTRMLAETRASGKTKCVDKYEWLHDYMARNLAS